MKKIFLVILPTLLFVACKSKPVKTETRMYELTFVDGKKKFIPLRMWILMLRHALGILVVLIIFICRRQDILTRLLDLKE